MPAMHISIQVRKRMRAGRRKYSGADQEGIQVIAMSGLSPPYAPNATHEQHPVFPPAAERRGYYKMGNVQTCAQSVSWKRIPSLLSFAHRCRYFIAIGVMTLPPLNSDILQPRAYHQPAVILQCLAPTANSTAQMGVPSLVYPGGYPGPGDGGRTKRHQRDLDVPGPGVPALVPCAIFGGSLIFIRPASKS